MSDLDTSLGGPGRQFPDTTWQMVTQMHAAGTSDYRQGMERLCRRYWKPMYYYARVAWAKSNEDAKDLTQAFLLWLVSGDALKRYVPDRGSFRSYLKVLLKRFIHDQADARHALKRGGGVKIVPLDSLEDLQPDPRATDPEKAFDRAWGIALAREAVERVRARFEADGRALQFRAYEEYDLRPSEARPSYADVAARLGLSESDVRNHLFAVRKEIAAEIHAELAKTVMNAGDLEEEWDVLFGE